jgi:hypothetical protein
MGMGPNGAAAAGNARRQARFRERREAKKAALRAEVAALRAEVAALRRQVASWEREAWDWEQSYDQAAREVLRLKGLVPAPLRHAPPGFCGDQNDETPRVGGDASAHTRASI